MSALAKAAFSCFIASLLVFSAFIEPAFGYSKQPLSNSQIEPEELATMATNRVPNPVTEALAALVVTIEGFDNNVRCSAAIGALIVRFDQCVEQSGNKEGCARQAARFIQSPLCESECSISLQLRRI